MTTPRTRCSGRFRWLYHEIPNLKLAFRLLNSAITMGKLMYMVRCITVGLVFLFSSLGAIAAPTTNLVLMGEAGTYYFFSPTNITINAGGTVVWTNVGTVVHDSTSRSNIWSSSVLNSGASWSLTFSNAGNYPYYCFFHRLAHPEQTGTVSVVTAPSTPADVKILNPTFSGGAFSFYFTTESGYNYEAQSTPSLNPASWFTFTNLVGNGSMVQVTDSGVTNASRYYRVGAQ